MTPTTPVTPPLSSSMQCWQRALASESGERFLIRQSLLGGPRVEGELRGAGRELRDAGRELRDAGTGASRRGGSGVG